MNTFVWLPALAITAFHMIVYSAITTLLDFILSNFLGGKLIFKEIFI